MTKHGLGNVKIDAAARLRLVAAIVFASTLSGCIGTKAFRPQAELPKWLPPHAQASDIKRIAVVPFQGKAPLAETVRQDITQQLAAIGYFEVVELPPATADLTVGSESPQSGPRTIYAGVLQARAWQVDTLVTGKVHAGYQSSGVAGVSFGDPTVVVVIDLTVIDVASGQVRQRQQSTKTYKGEIEDKPGGPDSEDQLFRRLAGQCTNELLSNTFAQRTTVPVYLASAGSGAGAEHIQRGNGLAQRGDWGAAQSAWQAALATNPNDDAALYNLGLACEAQRDYRQAAGHYAAARRLNDSEPYREAVERVGVAERQYLAALGNRPESPAGPAPVATRIAALSPVGMLKRLPPIY